MKQQRRRREATSKAGAPLWMVTYGDMVTLVLCFFVMLYSISTIDARKFDLAVSSLQGTFGILKGAPVDVEDRPLPTIDIPEPELEAEENLWEQLELVRMQLEQAIRDNDMVELVSVEMEQRGLVIRFADAVLFDLGRAEIRDEAMDILLSIAVILKQLENPIRVEGHTDNLPIQTDRFPSNWELSVARATTVVRYFIEEHELEPTSLSASGYSEYWPIADNETEEGRARNRRVDVVILHIDRDATLL